MKKYKLTDDSGFLAIVNADRYQSFVREVWDLNELMDHFVTEMNRRNLIIWAIRQLYDPARIDLDKHEEPHFEIIIAPATEPGPGRIESIFWWGE